MGKADRKRWDGNVRSMAIIAKPDDEITEDDLRFLRENYTSAGGLLPNAYSGGAFFTPTHVARFIIEALRGLNDGFTPATRFLEPSAGSGVFLEHLPPDSEVTALELDTTSARVTALLYPAANVIVGDALTHFRRDYYDFVIGNPPYGVSINVDAADMADDFVTLRKTRGKDGSYPARGKSEYAFIELAVKAARPGGYIAFVLPKGIAFSQAGEKLRALLRETCWHVASIELPGETFAMTGTTIKTDIHVWRKITPNARKVYVKYTEHSVGPTEESAADTFWYEGQPPILHAMITDIGFDKDGRSTDKWGDGLTQLDELLEAFTDGGLMRENTDPIAPGRDFNALNVKIPPHEVWREKAGMFAYWNVLTLGRGEEINGENSFDFTWQDRLVAEYNEQLTIREAA